MIWTGTCGFGRRQADVVRQMDAVEIQETFYRPVTLERANRWRSLAPPDFRFSVKASQFITHPATSPTYRRSGRVIATDEQVAYGGFQDSAPVRKGWDATLAVAKALGAVAIVFQTPASFGPSDANRTALYRFFESIRFDGMKGLELRGGWVPHVVERVCDDLGLVHVVDPFEREPATYGLAYFRLHGRPPGTTLYRYTYTVDDLVQLRSMAKEYDDAYVMFNNVTMHADAVRFREFLRTPRESVSPPG